MVFWHQPLLRLFSELQLRVTFTRKDNSLCFFWDRFRRYNHVFRTVMAVTWSFTSQCVSPLVFAKVLPEISCRQRLISSRQQGLWDGCLIAPCLWRNMSLWKVTEKPLFGRVCWVRDKRVRAESHSETGKGRGQQRSRKLFESFISTISWSLWLLSCDGC